jgi:hypothetical protein
MSSAAAAPGPETSRLAQVAGAACANCGHAFAGPRPRFCPNCGQETNVKPPTLREFAQQFGGAYLATEGALWRTLRLLLFKPGELTARYLAGQRKHFVLPLRLYLTISVLVLLVVRLTGSAVQVQVKPDDPDVPAPGLVSKPPSFSILALGPGSGFGMRKGVFYCEGLPGWLCARAKRHLDIDAKALPAEIDQFKDRFVGNLGGAMFVLLPSFALWLKLVYRNRRLRYTEHLVFALHVHAFWFLALGLVLTNVWWITVIGATAVPWYTLRAMRRVYGGRRWPRVLRALAVSTLYGVVMVFVLALLALWSLLA